MYGKLVYDRSSKKKKKERKNQLGWGGVEPKLQYIHLAQVVIHIEKDKIRSLPQNIYKNKFQLD